MKQEIKIFANGIFLEGIWRAPERPAGAVLFSHGSGSGRLSPRNNFVAEVLSRNNLASLLIDLLTKQEDENYANVSILICSPTAWLWPRNGFRRKRAFRICRSGYLAPAPAPLQHSIVPQNFPSK